MSKPGKKSVAYSGYAFPETGELRVFKVSWFTYETVIQSFRALIANMPLPEGMMFCVVLDNAPWHKKAIRLIWTEEQPEYADIREKMEYLSLPPYSPDLSPIEQVWRISRRDVTHNRYFSAIELMTEALDSYFGEFEEPNEKLASLCSWEFSKYDENGNKMKRSEKEKNRSKKRQHSDT